MKVTNYRSSDIEQVIEQKKMVLQQIGTIEMCIWTDDLEEAVIRTEDMLRNLELIKRMKYEKSLDDGTNLLVEKLKAQGVNATVFRFTHKKAD